ncbi:MAG: hypothetical protein V1909_02055 [Candidatus Micrarchaeota archaeon]
MTTTEAAIEAKRVSQIQDSLRVTERGDLVEYFGTWRVVTMNASNPHNDGGFIRLRYISETIDLYFYNVSKVTRVVRQCNPEFTEAAKECLRQ